MQAPDWASFLSIADGSLNPVRLCDLDQVLLKEVMAENRGPTLSDLKNKSPDHLSATLTGCQSPDGSLEPAAVEEDAGDQLSEKGHPDGTARHTQRRKGGAGRGKRGRHNTPHRPQPPRTGRERRAHTTRALHPPRQ